MRQTLLFLIWIPLLWSCQKDTVVSETDQPAEESGYIVFQLNLQKSSDPSTRALSEITQPAILDSLVKDLRVFVFDATSKCESYADFSTLRLSQSDSIRVTVTTGVKSFLFLTNVCDNKVIDPTAILGKTKAQILINLENYRSDGSYLFIGARQYFWGECPAITVAAGAVPILHQSVSLVRMIAQLETYVHTLQVWKMKNNNTQKDRLLAPGYIQAMRSNIVKYIPISIGLDKQIVTNTPSFGSDSAVIVSLNWTKISNDTIAKNVVLSFPSEGLSVYPTLLLATEVNSHHPDFVSDSRDLILPNGNVIRYWWMELKNYRMKENKILQINITGLLGLGSPVPPDPTPYGDIQYTITVIDWDPNVDLITGDNGGFTPL